MTSIKKKFKDYFKPEGIQQEMLRYRNNGVSSSLGYIGLISLIVAFCFQYSNTKITNKDVINLFGITSNGFLCAFDILVNILLMLFLFMAISRMKVYSSCWGIFSICTGVFEVIRPFIYPIALLRAGLMSGWLYTLYLICSLIAAASFVTAGFLSIYRGAALRNYLKTVDAIEGEKVKIK